jgi:hypothetical protein
MQDVCTNIRIGISNGNTAVQLTINVSDTVTFDTKKALQIVRSTHKECCQGCGHDSGALRAHGRFPAIEYFIDKSVHNTRCLAP